MEKTLAWVRILVSTLEMKGYKVGMIRVTDDPGTGKQKVQGPYIYIGYYNPNERGLYRLGRGWNGPKLEGRDTEKLRRESIFLPSLWV
jgi:hypothetical protein